MALTLHRKQRQPCVSFSARCSAARRRTSRSVGADGGRVLLGQTNFEPLPTGMQVETLLQRVESAPYPLPTGSASPSMGLLRQSFEVRR